ncbi:MAG: hypothetical protein RTU92_07450 [Candidatus Thorarchaeota archaeon]
MRSSNFISVKSISLIAILIVFGLSAPLITYSITRASPFQLTPPGIPISETVFANLSSNELDSAIFRGDFSPDNINPHFYSVEFDVNHSLIPQDLIMEAYNFIGEPLMSYLEPTPRYSSTSRGPPLIYLKFQGKNISNPNGLVISFNALTGRVVSYTPIFENGIETWPPELQTDTINEDGLPATEHQIQLKLVEFLSAHGYTLSNNMRLFPVIAFPNKTQTALYKIVIAYVAGSVIPYSLFQGIMVYMDAITGNVIDFDYQCIEIPEIQLDGLIDPNIILQTTTDEELVYYSNDDYSESYLKLFNIGGEQDNHSARLQLTWVLQYFNENKSPEPWEIHRDAYDGGFVNYNSNYYVNLGLVRVDANLLAMTIPAVSIVVATMCYIILKRKL